MLDDANAGIAIRPHCIGKILSVELKGKFRRPNEVAKHYGQLSQLA